MEIIILVTGCTKCKKLYERVKKVLAENKIEATVTKQEDIMEIMKYNVMTTPALVVDGKVVLKGKVPSEAELTILLMTTLSI